MGNRNFRHLLEEQWSRGNFVCVGLDSEFGKIPECIHRTMDIAGSILVFNKRIVEATKDIVCAYKPNSAFYEMHGVQGIEALQHTIGFIHAVAPDVPVILDAKRADIGKTNASYAEAAFGVLAADAVTVHPYLGAEALQPFLHYKDKGIFVLCRTSNPGAGEFQDLSVGVGLDEAKEMMAAHAPPSSIGMGGCYTSMSNHVAYQVSRHWNKNENCCLVVGATYPHELDSIRNIVGDMPILIPGIGAQGGDLEKTVLAGKDRRGKGMIINSSSGIIFASKGADFAEVARYETEKLRDLINMHREG